MGRATPPRGRVHRRLQRWYRARRLHGFLAPYVGPGEIAFDVGANKGEWTAALRDIGARVIAVEPQARCAVMMRVRFADDPEVRIVESAVGAEVGEGVLHLATTGSEHASMSDEWRRAAVEHRGMPADAWVVEEPVGVTTVDELIDRFGVPRLCKIDVEGLEAEVLAGLSRPLAAVTFEFHREMLPTVEACVELLEGLGGYRYGVFVDEWPLRTGEEVAPDALHEAITSLGPDAWGMVVARLAKDRPASAGGDPWTGSGA